MKCIDIQKDKGITLLLAVIIVSLVTSITLSLTVVVIKELGISSNLRESMQSFYVAESGFGCAEYWLIKKPEYFKSTGSSTQIKCQKYEGSETEVGGNQTYTVTLRPPDQSTFSKLYFEHLSDQSNNNTETLTLSVEGINESSPDQSDVVQRQRKLEVTIKPVELEDADIILVVDTSGSICRGDDGNCDYMYESTYVGNKPEYDLLLQAVDQFALFFKEEYSDDLKNNLRIGVVPFGTNVVSPSKVLGLTDSASDVTNFTQNVLQGYNPGRTNTIAGLVETVSLFDLQDSRKDIVVLVTDGWPSHIVDPAIGVANYPTYGNYIDTQDEDGNGKINDNTGDPDDIYDLDDARTDLEIVASYIRGDGVEINAAGVGVDQSANQYLKEKIVGEGVNDGIYVQVDDWQTLAEELLKIGSKASFELTQIR